MGLGIRSAESRLVALEATIAESTTVSSAVYIQQVQQQVMWEKGCSLFDLLPVLKEARRQVSCV